MKLAIRKLDYSRAPWRLVDADAVDHLERPIEFYTPEPFDHPYLGRTIIDEPVAGNTKAECLESTLRFLAAVITELQECRRSRRRKEGSRR
jgi:hypothetical protein